MIFARRKNLVLIPQQGPDLDRPFEIDGDEATISGEGREKDTKTIVLYGSSPVLKHARIRRAGNKWRIEPEQIGAIQLNGEMISRVSDVRSGDTIGFRSEQPGEYLLTEVKLIDATSGPRKPVIDAKTLSKYAKFAAIFIFYGGGLMYLGSYLAGQNEQKPLKTLDKGEIYSKLDKDLERILEIRPPNELVGLPPLDQPGGLYHNIILLGQEPELSQQRSEYEDMLRVQVKRMIDEAWVLENQKRWDDAIVVYKQLGELLPNPALHTTGFALQRASKLGKEE